ncbi:hypothetical protein [Pelosinus sp. sgz500959]|uniref:hypothetical protein n=1 Tax=Pelosinus sp. sgz500959 TaxID=3242472 RepID=UPI00366EB8EF
MPRKNSRRFTNHVREQDEQEFGDHQQKQQSPSGYENKSSDSDSLIADMAQGFMQAQAKMTDHSGNLNNLEITLLLQKVNEQLEEIKKTAQHSKSQDSQQQSVAQKGSQDNQKQSENEKPSSDLQTLLNSVLQGKANNSNNEKESSKSQKQDNNQSNEGTSQQNVMNVQTVSQVLAQAQYELANELENSLKKLKQVISESEKLASNISNLLGEESKKK